MLLVIQYKKYVNCNSSDLKYEGEKKQKYKFWNYIEINL